jgi:hypothetical protein
VGILRAYRVQPKHGDVPPVYLIMSQDPACGHVTVTYTTTGVFDNLADAERVLRNMRTAVMHSAGAVPVECTADEIAELEAINVQEG